MRIMSAAFAFFLLAIASAHALFLFSYSSDGNLTMLCEGQAQASISFPDGSVKAIALSQSGEASIAPYLAGPHTAQCGKQTLAATVPSSAFIKSETKVSPDEKAGWALLMLSASFILAMLLSFFFIARHLIYGRTLFCKSVDGGKARIHIRAGKGLSQIEVSDPVFMGYAGEPLSFRIAFLSAGQEWSYEYEIEKPERALPAALSAELSGQRISLLSRLMIDGEKGRALQKASTDSAHAPLATGEKGKPRPLPKAPTR